ncbi:lipopolysaccharide biosynthesis protein [Rhodococcus sp. NPDC056960]|uniref:lipopolysaccharide biosynthesis protein n=1 Tax=Rhodococcus sp. NPDC056960 TaxID=3345982 RepID=UPI00363B56CD
MKTLFARTAVSVGGGGVVLILQLISVPIAIRVAGLDDYGVWVALFSASQLIVMVDLGVGAALVKRAGLGITRTTWRHANYLFVTVGLVCAFAILYIFSNPLENLSHTLDSAREYELLILMACASTLCAFVGRAASSIVIGWGRFDMDRGLSIISSLARFAVILLALSLDLGVVLVAISDLLFVSIPAVGAQVYVRTQIAQRAVQGQRFEEKFLGLLKDSGPFFLLSLTGSGALQIQPVLVAALSDPTQTGLFAIAYRILMAGRQALTWVWTPSFTSFIDEVRDEGRISIENLKSSYVLHGLLVILLLIPIAVFREDLIAIWLAMDVEASYPAIIYVCAFLAAMCLYMPVVAAVNAIGMQKRLVVTQTVWFLLVLGLSVVSIRHFGASGAGLALLTATFVMSPAYLWQCGILTQISGRNLALRLLTAEIISVGFALAVLQFAIHLSSSILVRLAICVIFYSIPVAFLSFKMISTIKNLEKVAVQK